MFYLEEKFPILSKYLETFHGSSFVIEFSQKIDFGRESGDRWYIFGDCLTFIDLTNKTTSILLMILLLQISLPGPE